MWPRSSVCICVRRVWGLEGFSRLRDRMAQINDADAFRNWKNPINGNEIIERFHIAPGREIAAIKDAVKEAVMEGKIPYDHDAAWEYVLQIAPAILGTADMTNPEKS